MVVGVGWFGLGFLVAWVTVGAALSEASPWIGREARWLLWPAGLALLGAALAPGWRLWLRPGVRPLATALGGAALAATWTPCVGPVLGRLLGRLMQVPDAEALALLAVYTCGLLLPLLPLALLFDGLLTVLPRPRPLALAGRALGGAVLAAFGLALLTGRLVQLLGAVPLAWPAL